jgi:hypothetical protein
MAKKSSSTEKFQQAVSQTPDIASCLQSGLQAFGSYSNKVELASACEGSVDIDACVTAKYPNSNRWDYVFGYKGATYFTEVHGASTSQVSTVLRKLQWLKDWLKTNAPLLEKIKSTQQPFVWIASGRFDILPNSSQSRQIAQAGLKPISKLKLD